MTVINSPLPNIPAISASTCPGASIALCKRRFADDPTKSSFLYDGSCFADRAGVFNSDLAMPLDFIYHLVEDPDLR